jgi:FMN reductase [NAD(P)H]
MSQQAETCDLVEAFATRYGLEAGEVPELAGPPELLRFLERRSCRSFKGAPIPEPLLTALFACAQSAPSKSDLQQYAIIRLEAVETKAKFLALPSIPDWAADAGCLLVFCGDARRVRRLAEHHGLAYESNTADVYMNAACDAAIAMTGFILAAEAVGLGTCPLSVVRNHAAELAELLALPAGVFPFAGLCVGWPAAMGSVQKRLPQSAVVHRDRYDDSGLVEEVAAYERRRGYLPAEKQLHTDRYGIAAELGWGGNAARRLSVRERPGWRRFLADQGIELD